MRRFLLVVLVLSLAATGMAVARGGLFARLMGGDAAPAGVETRDITVSGWDRTYFVYTPASAPASNAPLVIAFHGGGADAARWAGRKDLWGMADRHGFILVVPVGLKNGWNTNAVNGSGWSYRNKVDDLGFVRAILSQMRADHSIDPARIYAMGGSLGGMMAYEAACNLPGQFAAIGVVSATLSSGRCASPQGVSLLHIHGTNDQNVPFNGGSGALTRGGGDWASAAQGISIFAGGAQCSPSFDTEPLTTDTTCHVSDCPGSDVVEYCLVQGGGHTWPGTKENDRQAGQGAFSTMTFSATDMIAEFFQAH